MADKTIAPSAPVDPATLRQERGTDTAVGASPASLPDAVEAIIENTRRRAELREPAPATPFRSGRDILTPANRRRPARDPDPVA